MNIRQHPRYITRHTAPHCFALTILITLFLLLQGCTTTTGLKALAQTHPATPLKILVLQAPMAVDHKRLQAVFSPDADEHQPSVDSTFDEQISHAQAKSSEAVKQELANQSLIEILPPLTDPALANLQTQDFDTPLSQADADRITQTTGAEAVLRYKITDYGLTPKAWRKAYITFEVTSTLAIAGSVALIGTKVARSAAGIYLVEEGTEELAEGYAGFWALNTVCRPVRIEAELVSLTPVKVIWHTSDTGFADYHVSHLIHKIKPEELNAQLDLATNHAAQGIIKALTTPLKTTN